MLADDELREALTTRLPDLEPGRRGRARPAPRPRRLARAPAPDGVRRRPGRRGPVLALVLGHDWRAEGRRARAERRRAGARARPRRGKYVDPEDLDPGRYRARVRLPAGRRPARHRDRPARGMGAGRRLRLRHGPSRTARHAGSTCSATCGGSRSIACSRRDEDQARSRRPRPRHRAHVRPGRHGPSAPTPVTLDGYRGYRVRLDPSPMPRGTSPCASDVVVREWPAPGDRQDLRAGGLDQPAVGPRRRGPPGPRQRQPRPDVTPAEEAELVEIVESISFVVP